MGNLGRRVSALEGAQVKGPGRWHRIIVDVGQTVQEAIESYGRDSIAPDDGMIIREIVASN